MELRIAAIARYLPTRVVTAAEISELLGVGEEWLLEHTGVAGTRVRPRSRDERVWVYT